MFDLLASPTARLVLLISATAILVAIGLYVAGRLRAGYADESAGASDLLTNFREMHSKGVLSDEEFRTIKTHLTGRLRRELRDTNETR
jgi:uncharacterized membrane protein